MNTKLAFLPADYEAPRGTSNYMKLEEGVNRVRILSQPIFGWEDWHDKKPVRYRYDEKPDQSYDPKRPVKHFWAMIVWNYNVSAIQILHVTQASIRKGIEALASDDDWGHPALYDLKITKKGEGVDTEYTVNPVAPSDISPDIVKAFRDKPIWLDALFDNQDPFLPAENGSITPLAVSFGPSALESPKPKKSDLKPRKAVLEEDSEGIEIELFMDLLPEACLREDVEEFVELCAKVAKIAPETYMAKQLEQIPKFVMYFNEWLGKRRPSKS